MATPTKSSSSEASLSPRVIGRWQLRTVAFTLSGGLLIYEILLTRIASVMLTSDHVFLVLGLALLGLAAGAVADYLRAVRPGHRDVPNPGVWLGGTGSLIVGALVLLITGGPAGGLPVLATAAALPFVGGGLAFARLFGSVLIL